jgi:hypothetical protein
MPVTINIWSQWRGGFPKTKFGVNKMAKTYGQNKIAGAKASYLKPNRNPKTSGWQRGRPNGSVRTLSMIDPAIVEQYANGDYSGLVAPIYNR